jgi:hypothetical protein
MRTKLFDLLFLIAAGFLVFYLSQKPVYNWDMISYMGVATEYSVHDPQVVHDSVYHDLKREVPAPVYRDLTGDHEERRACLLSSKEYNDQLSYFRAKPLYTLMIAGLNKAGVSLVRATLIPSIIACFFLMLLVYHWLSLYLKKPFAFVTALLMSLLPIFVELDRFSTPDAVSNFFVLLSLYLVTTGKNKWWILLSLFLSVVARVDNFVLAIVVAYFLYLKGTKNVVWKLGIVGAVAGISIIGIPVLMGDSPTWFTKFAFLGSVTSYVNHWRDVIYTLRTDALYLLLILAAAFMLRKADYAIKMPLIIIVITILARLILFPSLQERFYAAYEFTVIILLVKYLSTRPGLIKLKRVRAM